VPPTKYKKPYNKETDPELVSLCLEGDAGAWEALVLRYRRLIYSIPLKFGLGGQDRADIFQNVCLRLIEHLQDVKDENRLSAWLITTATRLCISLIENRQREPVTGDEEVDERLDPDRNIEEIRIYAEEQQEIRDSVNQLPERCKTLIDMLYLDARSPSYQEISELMGMPAPSIGPNRARCLEKLKKILQGRGIK